MAAAGGRRVGREEKLAKFAPTRLLRLRDVIIIHYNKPGYSTDQHGALILRNDEHLRPTVERRSPAFGERAIDSELERSVPLRLRSIYFGFYRCSSLLEVVTHVDGNLTIFTDDEGNESSG